MLLTCLLPCAVLLACAADLLCCWPVLRSASFLGGLMRMSASMCLILMEMTGRQAALLDTSRTDHLADM